MVTIYNTGINGNNVFDLLFRVDVDVLAKQPDLVLLMVGTNDMLNDKNVLAFDVYENNYQKLINTIKPHAKLVLMTIAPVNEQYILERVPERVYMPEGPQGKVGAANTIVKRLAQKNELSLIDINHILLSCGGSTLEADSIFMNVPNFGINDGVHPTAVGYKVIGTAVYSALKYLEPDVKNIVCFGDSITKGYRVAGEGTIEGDTYPAVLNRLYNKIGA